MWITLGILGVVGLASLGLMIKEWIYAPEGYQTEGGFYVVLPPAVASKPVAKATEEVRKPVSANAPAHPHLKILVVDDKPDICLLLSTYLQQDAHTVVSAEDGCAALEKFRHDQFDLVITDRVMPRMDGDQLASAIHKIKPSEPIILMTGYTEPKPLSSDIHFLIQKPFSQRSIREAIDTVLAA